MKIISYDLGTGGVKASLYDDRMQTISKSFIEYDTYYPASDRHEQCPEDWWKGVADSTRALLEAAGTSAGEIDCVSLSGHSLVAIPLDSEGNMLMEQVPIWSDTRALAQTQKFFEKVPEKDWYMTTGNGFPAPCYSIFKLMWMKDELPEVFGRMAKAIGSKDYINYRLTGNICMDNSYASGTGAYDLKAGKMREDYLLEAGLPADIFPDIVPSHTVVGKVTEEAARQTGLCEGTAVVCGGVDNACMALGAVGAVPGRVYTSLGSSSWIPVNSTEPVLDFDCRPYVFAHIQEGLFTSAFSIFAGGSSFQWVRDNICRDIPRGKDVYNKMTELAEGSPIGSGGIIFNPSLAGGTSQDKSINIRGAYVGLHLGTKQEDMIRAAMEGIAMNLKISLDFLSAHTEVAEEILFCGGGSKSKYWMQMFADVFDKQVVKTNIDQDAASLGAAAIAARGIGLWEDYSPIGSLHHVENRSMPDNGRAEQYAKLFKVFVHVNDTMADLGDYMSAALKDMEKQEA